MCNVVPQKVVVLDEHSKEETVEGTSPLETVHVIPNSDDDNDNDNDAVPLNDVEDDAHSSTTYSTLFSDYYDDEHLYSDDDESEDHDDRPPPSRFLRLERSFAERDEILVKLISDDGGDGAAKDSRYVQMLYRHEFAVRRALLHKLEKQVDALKDHEARQRQKEKLGQLTESLLRPKNLPKQVKACSQQQPASPLTDSSWYLFETRHSLPGVATLCLFCLCHNSLYELITQILYDTTAYIENQDALYVAVFLLGVLLCRISGGIFDWLSPQQYNLNKFESHNRLRLQKWDAVLLRKLKHSYPLLRYAMYYVGYCLVLICMYYYHTRLLSMLLDSKESILESLPSQQPGRLVNTPVDDRLRTALYGYDYELPTKVETDVPASTEDFAMEEEPTCLSSSIWTGGAATTEEYTKAWEDDEHNLFSQVSTSHYMAFMGDPEAALVPYRLSFAFYSFTVILSIWLMRKMGFRHAAG